MGGSVRRSRRIPENARFGTAGEKWKFVGMAADRQASEPLLGLRGNAGMRRVYDEAFQG